MQIVWVFSYFQSNRPWILFRDTFFLSKENLLITWILYIVYLENYWSWTCEIIAKSSAELRCINCIVSTDQSIVWDYNCIVSRLDFVWDYNCIVSRLDFVWDYNCTVSRIDFVWDYNCIVSTDQSSDFVWDYCVHKTN